MPYKILAVTIALLFSPVSVAAAEVVRCTHQFPPTHHVTALIEYWAGEVERLSSGRLVVDLIGESKLFPPDENILVVAKGDVHCGFSLNFDWARKLPLMTVTLSPFLTASPNIPRAWPESEAAKLLENQMMLKGVQPVVWLFQTNQSVITSNGQFVLRPEDFDGLKVRGLVPPFDRTLAEMGATVLPMKASQLYEAMRAGVIESAITDVAVAVARRFYEQQDHMVVLPLVSVYVTGYVTPQWYDLLDEDLKAAFRQAGENAARWSVEYSESITSAAPDALRKQGVAIHVATEEEIAALKAVMGPAFRRAFLEDAGAEEGNHLLDLVEKLK